MKTSWLALRRNAPTVNPARPAHKPDPAPLPPPRQPLPTAVMDPAKPLLARALCLRLPPTTQGRTPKGKSFG